MPLSPGRAGVDSEDRRGRRPLPSTPHIASVETASYAGVGSAFHNCPPVGKQSHFVGRVPEFQHEFVVSHHAVRLQAALQLAKIDGPGALVYLHRIASAQSDMGTSLARQMYKLALPANPAAGPGMVRPNLRLLIAPEIVGPQRLPQFLRLTAAHHQLYGF